MTSGPSDALDKFQALEGRIGDVLEVLQRTRAKNETAETDLAEARRRIKRLENEIETLRRERTLVRGRVQSLIESIFELSEKQIV